MPAPQVDTVKGVGEQSNTTAIADDKFVVKIFRRLQSGIHPEIEMGRFLTDIVHYPNAPPFLGSMELREANSCTALAVAHEFIQNQGDAWTVTNAYLDRFVDEQRVLAPDAPAGSSELTSYLHRVRHIGQRTAELQNALASRPDIAEFAPEPLTPDDVTAWTDILVRRADGVFGELSRRRLELNETIRAQVDLLLASRDDILGQIRTLLPVTTQALKIRHHGDFHLGQVLFAKDDAYILDFEGEPQRDLAERRLKAPAARDIAGLVRSIDYAASAAFERALEAWPDEHARLLHALEDFSRKSIEAFMSSYREALTNPLLWPGETADANRLLDFFVLEKAFYEINYELTNRPNWLRVPLMGLQRILSQGTSP
jgi:maltose alpha-D-glucosyltransferase/alpha-amylase